MGNLKSRMAKRQSSVSSVVTASVAASGGQIYDDDFGFGNFSHHASTHQPQRSSSVPNSRPTKEEVEGSKPRKWYPAKAPKAPPGGAQTFHPALNGKEDPLLGRKRFPDMDARGQNRDSNAVEALRF